MEMKHKILPPEALMGPVLELLEEGQTVPLVISGGSMVPFLVGGRDTVYLSGISRDLRQGDMVLYRRDNGAYVLHRIRKAGRTYTLVGDAQTRPEPGIREDQMLALVTAVRRKGKLLGPGSFWWDFFEKVWIRVIPLRPLARGIYRLLSH